MSSASHRAAGNTCSKLSSSISVRRPEPRLASRATSATAGGSPVCSARQTAGPTRSGSAIGARSTKRTPAGKSSPRPATTSSASRVLPAPAGPVRVTRRAPPERSIERARSNSAARPTSGVGGTGTHRSAAFTAPEPCRADVASTSRSASVSRSASASSATVSRRGVRRRPRSSVLTASTLRPERSASSCCVRPAARRWRRSRSANVASNHGDRTGPCPGCPWFAGEAAAHCKEPSCGRSLCFPSRSRPC